MEQDVDGSITSYRHVCSGCLSSDRNLFAISDQDPLYEVFKLILFDYGERFPESLGQVELLCWECMAMLRKFTKFKRQVLSAQEHLRVLSLSQSQEMLDHTYMAQSLSGLEATFKSEYDKIFFDYTSGDSEWAEDWVKDEQFELAHAVRELDDMGQILEVHQPVVLETLEVPIEVRDELTSQSFKQNTPMLQIAVSPLHEGKLETVIIRAKDESIENDTKCGYITTYMSEEQMLAQREEDKLKIQYAVAVYKCELCIIGFYSQQQVEDHFITEHRAKPNRVACKICYSYVDKRRLQAHTRSHYMLYTCRICNHNERVLNAIRVHCLKHSGSVKVQQTVKRKKSKDPIDPAQAKPGDLRKLLSKTTIEGYKCLECDMFFKNSRARKNHVARCHREGLQCDHCKKRFVNRTTLATHLRLHEGPLPREECPVCHKMVRVIQLKYHIQRHQNKNRYECVDCQKIFSHLATYQAHLKYSRAHASDDVFKFPCPMCNKGYPTKEQMQDHFNYQHLGKTSHKCPVCDKPIASRANVEKHMMRVHGEKKPKPRNHVCQQCGKGFTDKKALTQHEVIHSGERPLTCDICQQTFKQKASLYTHRKRLHKVFPAKRQVEFMDSKIC